jgi:hypothetical protein
MVGQIPMAKNSDTRHNLPFGEGSKLPSSGSILIEQLSPQFLVDKWEAGRMLGLSPETLKKYRDRGYLIEDIHYYRWNQRLIRYNITLLKDWAVHRNNPAAHQRAIELYLASLACNQPKKRGRRA